MKKTTSVVLLLVLLFNFGGYLFFFFIQLQNIRQEAVVKIKQGIPSDDLVEIFVTTDTTADLIWKESNEFSLNGSMYDVVYKKSEADLTTYYCYSDTEEMELLASLNRVIKNLRNHHKRQNIIKILKVYQNFERSNNRSVAVIFRHKAALPIYHQITYKNLSLEVNVPPPKLS